MNKAKLKSYAPQARKDFIAAVTARAHLLGLDDQHGQLKVAPAQTQGDVTLIAGQAWPAKVDGQRQQLIARMQREGFDQTVEAVAYTWFNRFAALRYMELRDYLGHGYRALSSRDGGLPEILSHASELAQAGDLPGLKASQINELKLAGNRDGELYRLLLIAQCNALHQAMPFLFERIDDETELLLPDNLLLSDSVIAKLVAEIPEEDWAEVEIIGWLYQFYISEKKDQVIGKVVKSEDIPAATQLFTPNWIVQYLVQNSVGRLWLMANPGSTLASQWPYYIQPAEQTPEVQAQLDALIQTRVREDGETLNPETITVLDPACGSGHILVVAYDVLKAIYLERGYQPRTIPRLILEKNLYGLDIDDRAAQLAAFALLMKARADDRRLFADPPKLNVLSLQSSAGLNYEELCTHLAPLNVQRHTIWDLIETFEYAKTFGSLIQVPYALKTHLTVLPEALALVKQSGDMYAIAAADDLLSLVKQALLLGMQFDAVVANPPYMGARYYDAPLKRLVEITYKSAKADLYTCFMLRNIVFSKNGGIVGMITIPNWMSQSSFEELRALMFSKAAIETFSHNGRGVFGSDFGSCAFTFRHLALPDYKGRYKRLFEKQGSVSSNEELDDQFQVAKSYDVSAAEFQKIPGSPVAYWVTARVFALFEECDSLSALGHACSGLQAGNNDLYLRQWFEVSILKTKLHIEGAKSKINPRWLPHRKGGAFRRWYGNADYILDWKDEGIGIRENPSARPQNIDYWFKPAVSWSHTSISLFSARYAPAGSTFNVEGPSFFSDDPLFSTGLMCSAPVFYLMQLMNPTLHFLVGSVSKVPVPTFDDVTRQAALVIAKRAVELTKWDWDCYERSWDFQDNPILRWLSEPTLELAYLAYIAQNRRNIVEMNKLEEENNRIFIDAYNLAGELKPNVPTEQITLTVNPAFRYGSNLTKEEEQTRFRQDSMAELVSYAIGCMMGRYSLDEPGLIYAHAGNVGFDPSRYEKKFPADADGIVPLTDEPWFTDDAASRVREFLRAVWGPDTLEENMAWLAESLGVKGSETPDETIRRYLADKFFKDHLQTYKKRPIYWLFSSGKQGAFQALVYLHRYHEGTLARLRAEYVVPLTGKMQARLDMLQKDAQAATSTAARNKISKEIEKLKKKHLELLAYDEKLRHYADMRITLDLDDGVKVNYGKFGDLLAEVKAVTGGKDDE